MAIELLNVSVPQVEKMIEALVSNSDQAKHLINKLSVFLSDEHRSELSKSLHAAKPHSPKVKTDVAESNPPKATPE